MSREYYIGCISGTSLDGLDIALVCFEDEKISVLNTHCSPIPRQLQKNLTTLCLPGPNEIDLIGEADVALGDFIGKSISNFIQQTTLSSNQISAIGSHGQTVRHRPNAPHPFTTQIGNGHVIAEHTNITTIADFRMADMAAGGQGAPLVPAFHKAIFSNQSKQRLIINLGGISNISVIPPRDNINAAATGFDIGPANALMDRWIEKHKGLGYDKNGAWAEQGKLEPTLLNAMLKEPFFSLPAPKSTGREHFNLDWLAQFTPEKYPPENVQRTLLELTAVTIASTIKLESENDGCEVFVCGGGAHNLLLVERICSLSGQDEIKQTNALGVPVGDVEACAFAWLARQTFNKLPGNLTSVTGAKSPKVLGAVYLP